MSVFPLKMEVLGGETLGGAHEGGTLSRELPSPFHHVRTQRDNAGCGPGTLNRSASIIILYVPVSRTVRNQFLLFMS